MKKTNQKTTKQKRDRKEDKKARRVVTLSDVELTHVNGGVARTLAFCTTPWD